MMIIKVKIYTDKANLDKANDVVNIVNNYVNGDDITHPWDMFKWENEIKVLDEDFIEADMYSLFPEINEYPRITLSQNDRLPPYRNRFTLDTIDSALRNLHSFIR